MRHVAPVFIVLSLTAQACSRVTSQSDRDVSADIVDASDVTPDDGFSEASQTDRPIRPDTSEPRDVLLGDTQTCMRSSPPNDRGVVECSCLGASSNTTGFCARGLFCSETSACQQGICAGQVSLIGRSLDGTGCAELGVCRELARRLEAFPSNDPVVCIYSDGSIVRTGVVPEVVCPPSSEGVLCAPGCASCAEGLEHCWGSSENNPLGFCHIETMGCSDTIRCPPGYQCLRPRNLNAQGVPASGVCESVMKCRQVAGLAPDRFRCVE